MLHARPCLLIRQARVSDCLRATSIQDECPTKAKVHNQRRCLGVTTPRRFSRSTVCCSQNIRGQGGGWGQLDLSKQTFTSILPRLPHEADFVLDVFAFAVWKRVKLEFFGHASRAYGLVRLLLGK